MFCKYVPNCKDTGTGTVPQIGNYFNCFSENCSWAGAICSSKEPTDTVYPSRTCRTEEVESKGEAEEAEPEVEVERVGEDPVVGVVVPAPRQWGPDALAQDVHQLGAHASDGDEREVSLYLNHSPRLQIVLLGAHTDDDDDDERVVCLLNHSQDFK